MMTVALLALFRLSAVAHAAVPADLAAVHDGLLARFDSEAGNADCLTGLVQEPAEALASVGLA